MVYALEINPTTFPSARFTDIGSLLNIIVPLFTIAGALGFFFMLIWSGITIITGGGNAEAVTKAQKMATFSVLGLVIIVSSWLIITLIKTVFGLSFDITQ